MADEFSAPDGARERDALSPAAGFEPLSSLEIDVRLAVMEYADVAGEYAAVVADPRVPRSALDDYGIVVDILALARRAPAAEIPSLLSIGTRALLRVHRALPGAEADDADDPAEAA